MGNIQDYCCRDSPERTEDEREEQSCIWSEQGSNLQYGACLPPPSPPVYKIVLPKLELIEIENFETSLNQSNNSNTSAEQQPLSPSSSSPSLMPTSPTATATTPQLSDVEAGDVSEIDSMLSTDQTASNNCNSKTRNKSKKKRTNSKYDPNKPAVIKEEYCAEQFEHLRSLIFRSKESENRFKQLLWSCVPWSAPGGKSGSTFLKTINDQFILKEMSKLELQSFLSIADEYFKYIENSYNENKPSLLSTILGIFRISYTSGITQSSSEYYFMVMRNLFYKRNISQTFDLKGSVRNRLTDTKDPDNTEHVLMDENLLKCDHPLFIHARSKQILNECIDSDSRFLTSISVMDYSLLVGVDKENQNYVLGIIDYVRPFTWDKKIERVVKSVVSLELPTIIEPELYRERFCEAMDKYFESVPDTC